MESRGAKPLHLAITEVLGANSLVQRCSTHKLRNVRERLPKDDEMLLGQTRSLMRAAWRSPNADEGMARMRKLAEQLERNPDGGCSDPVVLVSAPGN